MSLQVKYARSSDSSARPPGYIQTVALCGYVTDKPPFMVNNRCGVFNGWWWWVERRSNWSKFSRNRPSNKRADIFCNLRLLVGFSSLTNGNVLFQKLCYELRRRTACKMRCIVVNLKRAFEQVRIVYLIVLEKKYKFTYPGTVRLLLDLSIRCKLLYIM